MVINVKKRLFELYTYVYVFMAARVVHLSINPVLYIHWVNIQLRLITNAVLRIMQLFDKTNMSV